MAFFSFYIIFRVFVVGICENNGKRFSADQKVSEKIHPDEGKHSRSEFENTNIAITKCDGSGYERSYPRYGEYESVIQNRGLVDNCKLLKTYSCFSSDFSQMNLPQVQRILQEFEKQSEVMDMKEEIMNDAIDDALEDEGDEEERYVYLNVSCGLNWDICTCRSYYPLCRVSFRGS